MTVSKFVQPDFTAQDATTYKGSIDGAFSATRRLAAIFAPRAKDTPDMSVIIDAGCIFNGTSLVEVPAQTSSFISAPISNNRIDRIVIDRDTGAVSVVSGAENLTPSPPAIPDGKVPVARILLTPLSVSITNAMIEDERILSSLGLSSLALSARGQDIVTGSIPNTALVNMPAKTVHANAGIGVGGDDPGPPQNLPASDILDFITGTGRGDILFRGLDGWQRLPSGLPGYVLKSSGIEQDPVWGVGDLGGAKTSTSSTKITLTASSERYQVITMTNRGSVVVLPHPVTLSAGGPVFVIKNASTTLPLSVYDHQNNTVVIIGPQQLCFLVLSEAGVWSAITSAETLGALTTTQSAQNSGLFLEASSSDSGQIALLDTDKFIVAWRLSSTSTLKAAVVSLANNIFTAGAAVDLEVGDIASDSGYANCLVALSATKAVLTWRKATAANIKAVVLDVSGTAVTVGTPVVIDSTSTPYIDYVSKISATQALVAYSRLTGSTGRAVVLDISGSTITVGTSIQTATSYAAQSGRLAQLTSSTWCLVHRSGGSGINGAILTVSGSTVTAAAINTGLAGTDTGVGSYIKLAPISATKCLVAYGCTQILRLRVLSISGSTITANAPITSSGSTTSAELMSLLPVGTDKFILVGSDTIGGITRTLTLGLFSVDTALNTVTQLYQSTTANGQRAFGAYAQATTINDDLGRLAFICPPYFDSGGTPYAQVSTIDFVRA